MQIAVPSRERVPAYAELRREVSELVGEVNGDFGTPEWQPVVYLRRSVNKQELAALYSAADVAWVGPLRDGMNLVAKEYVACQHDGDGVLVLSEFAGAAQELGEALRINPYDEVGTAETPSCGRWRWTPSQRAERMAALHERVHRNDAVVWAERFIDGLREATASVPADDAQGAAGARCRRGPGPRSPRPNGDCCCSTTTARSWTSSRARRTRRRRRASDPLLRDLAALPDTTDGHRQRPLAGAISSAGSGTSRRLGLAVEHGALMREPGADDWEMLRGGMDLSWKDRVRPLLEQFAASAPGSLVENKEYALAWHYRLVDAEFGAWLANELVTTLENLLGGTELAVIHGNKVVEVRYAWANKGEVAAHLAARFRRKSFVLAIGDDRTDEDLFAQPAPQRLDHPRRHRLDRCALPPGGPARGPAPPARSRRPAAPD